MNNYKEVWHKWKCRVSADIEDIEKKWMEIFEFKYTVFYSFINLIKKFKKYTEIKTKNLMVKLNIRMEKTGENQQTWW